MLSSCVATKNKNYTFNQKYSATKVREDIVLLKKILEANHPSLYWYTTKDSIDYYFNQTLASITDSLTEIQAKNKMAFIISRIKCGHTSVHFSKQFVALADKYKYPQFPLSIKVWKDSFVVLGYYNKEDSLLKRGTIITSINGKKNKQIIDDVFQYISTDGNSNNYKSQSLTGNFPAWYRNVYGIDSNYVITYLDSNKLEKTTTIKWHYPKPDITKKQVDSTKAVAVIAKPKPIVKPLLSKRQLKLLSYRTFAIDTGISTSFIKLNTFSKGNLRCFINSCFKDIDDKQIKNLVIDLRENGGGSIATSIHFIQYLVDSNFKIADTVAAINRKLEYGNYIKGWFSYWTLSHLFATKKSDGLIHNRWYETHYFKPKSKYHFNGNVYIIQGGYTFSASTIFSSFLKGQSNVKIVGEESGGGFYGNSAMHIPNIYLPNTKLRVRLPLYKYVMDKDRPKGQGVLPDIEIQPNSNAIRNAIDPKMSEVLRLIRESNKQNK